MKILVVSDSHGNIANLKAVMEIAKKSNMDAVIHCGDWDNIESVETVLSFGIPLYTVLGNADIHPETRVELEKKSEKFAGDHLEITLGEKKIGITHKPGELKKYFEGKKLDVIFCGHIHSKDESKAGGIKIVRPGAIVKGINFAVYDTASDTIEFVNE